jgi:hypothetical protein
MAEAPHRRIATVDCAVVNRFVIPAPGQMSPRASAKGGIPTEQTTGNGRMVPVSRPAVNKDLRESCQGVRRKSKSAFVLPTMLPVLSLDVAPFVRCRNAENR